MRRKQPENADFYLGSQWSCLPNELEQWMEDYLQIHPEFIEFYRHTNCPDESFFQTILMNSPYKSKRLLYLHYIDWNFGRNSSKNLDMSDIDTMMKSAKLMSRKFEDEDMIESIVAKNSSR